MEGWESHTCRVPLGMKETFELQDSDTPAQAHCRGNDRVVLASDGSPSPVEDLKRSPHRKIWTGPSQ